MRIIDFAQKNNISKVEIIKFLKERGVKVSSTSTLKPRQIEMLKKRFKIGVQVKQNTKDYSSVVIDRQPMSLGAFADALGAQSSEVIVYFLKQGVVANRNHVLSEEQVESAAVHFGAQIKKEERELLDSVELVDKAVGADKRLPVVTVMGHVDHGKTTLLDYIRRAHVAEKEVGGITQHLGAYEVETGQGDLIMLDTPGHEAFSVMRERGALVADLVILVVAADDGLMPQTRESIKIIQEFDLPVVVAVNKIDKANSKQIEDVKRQLAEVGLLPDEWGGDVPCAPVSAKNGTGMDEMLDLVALQAEMIDLSTDLGAEPEGYILESKMQHGRGSVATVILHRGVLKVGDFIVSKSSRARISSISNSVGKQLEKVGPSVPVQVAGFDSMPVAGEVLRQATAQEYKKWSPGSDEGKQPVVDQAALQDKKTINLVVRASSVSSQQSLSAALRKIKVQGAHTIKILEESVGDITENLVDFALNTDAIIVGLDVKVDNRAQLALDKNPSIKIILSNIIYKLLENIEQIVESTKEPEYKTEVLGSGYVKATFFVKGIGKIAGVQIEAGEFKQGEVVQVFRNDKQIGEGVVRSLQKEREKRQVVTAGNDCAFSVKEFDDWKEGDVVQCVKKTRIN